MAPDIVNIINSTYFPQYHKEKYNGTWRLSSKGVLMMSSVYRLLTTTNTRTTISPSKFNWIWNLHCPNKMKFFPWLCQHSRIPSRSYLASLGIDVNATCSLCNSPETIRHIFLECSNVRKMWQKLGVIYQINRSLTLMIENG